MGNNIALILQLLACACLAIAWTGISFPQQRPKRWEFMGYLLLVLSFMLVGVNIGIHPIGR